MLTVPTKRKQEQFFNNYYTTVHRKGYRDLNDVYSTYSYQKHNAQFRILQAMDSLNAHSEHLFASGYTITGHNHNTFSAAFRVSDTDTCKGVAIIYCTAYTTYCIPLESYKQYTDTLEKYFGGL